MNQPNKQEAQVALVTGGARRIGAAIVKKLHAGGYRMVIHCRSTLDEAHALAQELNQIRMDSAFVLQRELTAVNAAQEMISTVIEWAGRIDLLVNNASAFMRTDCTVFAVSDWDTLFDSNVKVPFALSVAAYPFLKKQRGCIINITDIHGERPLQGYAVYCQTKAALEMQTKALAKEFAPEVRVNAVAPGATIWPEHGNSLDESARQKIIAKTPLQTHGHPDFIADAVWALVGNSFITGQTLQVDGGRGL